MIDKEINDPRKNIIGYQKLSAFSIAIAVIIPPIVGYFIVLFFTSSVELLARRLWSLPVIWPDALYIGGVLGGLLGGLIGLWEIFMFHNQKREVISGKIISTDLYYIIALVAFTYILEFLSDSLIPQGILFFLEIGFFLIIGWNLTKILLETETKPIIQQQSKTSIDNEENQKIENYMSD